MKEKEIFKNTGHLKEERYKYAVEVSARLFLEKGTEEVKMTDIAENTGIGVASLYRYFETKTEIIIRSGSILWNHIREDFLNYLEQDKSETGFEQLVYRLGYFKSFFTEHKQFLKFLDNFDRIMLSEKVEKERLLEYEKSIVNFFTPVLESCEKGKKDGTVRKEADISSVYFSVTHALVAVCQKFIRGEILPSDDFSEAEKEIDTLLEITASYLAA